MVAAALARRYIVSDGPQGGAGRGRPSRARDDRAADRAPLDVRSASAAASEGNACGQVNTDKARAGGSPSKGVMRRLRAAGVGSGHLCFFMSAKYWPASSAVVHMPGRGFCPPSSRPFLQMWSCAW